MASVASRNTITRQWELLKLLPSRPPGFSAGELQQALSDAGYQISKRTVERDLVDLSLTFPLLCNDKSMPFGWYWAPGQSADLPGVTLSEALTLRLIEDSIRPLIPGSMLKGLEPRFSLASRKLESLNGNNHARWLGKVASVQPELTTLPPQIKAEVLDVIQSATLAEQQIQVRYHSRSKDQAASYTLNPHALVQRSNTTYLIATVGEHADLRQFALHRFQCAEQLEAAAEIAADFDLDIYIRSGAMQFGSAENIRLEAWVNSQFAGLLRESPISADMQLTEAEGGELLSATVANSWELRWWVLSHTGSIRVMQPAALKDNIVGYLQRGLDLYNL